MSEYRRNFVAGGTFFFTVVTQHRKPLFLNTEARRLLGDILRECFARYETNVIALVLLPEHLHTIWSLPQGDFDYSLRWRWIKREFTRLWLDRGGDEQPVSEASRSEQRRGVWQRRFWEHTIKDDADLEAHFDYIHYNPVKHGFVAQPLDYPWSTFHRWVRLGHYPQHWGAGYQASPLPGNAGEI